ncbi:sugar ABC transporter permease [Terrarubrum flagellatum]|uniref:carbohydrate ABC transporter permease n=1 Tax=Terrirubrum flagellatum TaxID=2895980 RepID=UPI00314531CE
MFLQKRARFAYYLILPSLLIITLLDLVPIIESVVVSLQSQNMGRANPDAFVGLAHYARALFDEPTFWSSLWKTLIWTAFSVIGAYLVALGLALLLHMDIWGRGFFRALFLVPWVIPDVATALLWKWLYGDEFGVINFLLTKIGVINRPVLWLSDPLMAMPAVVLVQVWKLYPVMFVVLLAALQNVPKELSESAVIDGANIWQRFRFVTFPFIKATSIIVTLLASIWTFQAFDIVYLLTGGGPAGATKILPTLVYDKAFWGLEIGYASAIALLMLIALLIISVAYLLLYRAQSDVIEEARA